MINLKIKEIRLENIKVYKNDTEIYNGKVENAPNEILESHVSSIHFDTGILIIKT